MIKIDHTAALASARSRKETRRYWFTLRQFRQTPVIRKGFEPLRAFPGRTGLPHPPPA